MKKKHVSLLLAAAMAASVISGCGNSANNSAAETEKTETTAAAATSAAEETTAAEAAEDTEKNETDEVVIATPRDAVQGSGDAYYCWEGAYVWEALTANNGGVIDPWLAKSWEHNDDLFPPVARHYRALQEAEADCVKAVEMVRRAVKRFSPLDSLAGRDHVLNAFNFLERQPER